MKEEETKRINLEKKLNNLIDLKFKDMKYKINEKNKEKSEEQKDLNAPKLYPVILKKRKSEINQNAYNFIKDEKNELKGDLKENIKKINKKISECKEFKNLKKEEIFLYFRS
jgi:hypothetical protein